MDLLTLVCFFALIACNAAEDIIQQCPGKSIDGLTTNVHLTPCNKSPCKLKKGTTQHVEIKFTPEHDLDTLTNSVQAELFGVPLPFIGVDGNSVCEKLQTESGDPAKCPLKAGTTYVYKDSFPVLRIYPSIAYLKVHWALQNKNKDIICFEVPASIAGK